jgi:Mn-containing catalase
MDIGTEELSHLEVVGTLARLHLAPMKFKREFAEADPLIVIAGGGGVNLFNSMGGPWTADYLKVTAELDVDLRSNIAAEARAKIVCERLINFCNDLGTKDALQFLMTREITHMKAFAAALDSLGKDRFSIGKIAPSVPLVTQYFNDSTGEGEHGEIDTTGRCNEGGDLQIVESPAFQALNGKSDGAHIECEASGESDAEAIRELLVDQMRDLLHAQKQLLKGLPKMAKAASHQNLAALFETHLAETEGQVERLNEGLKLLDAPARAKACKGMKGLLEEGDDVIAEKSRCRSGADRRGAESGALRDLGLHYGAQLGATAEDAWPNTLASDVACRGAECRPVAQPGSTALDVLCAHASTN